MADEIANVRRRKRRSISTSNVADDITSNKHSNGDASPKEKVKEIPFYGIKM